MHTNCEGCGVEIFTLDRTVRICNKCAGTVDRTGLCAHRGESTRAVECESCRGSVKVKVFECAQHGECTIKKRVCDIKVCYECVDFSTEMDSFD